MPTRGERLDSRDWGSWSGNTSSVAALAPGEPIPQVPVALRYNVVFLDLSGLNKWACPRPARLDCLPLIWTRLDSVYDPDAKPGEVEYAITRRTWTREYGDAGVVYREQAPTRFQPTAYQAGKPPKAPKRRAVPDVEPVEEEWAS